MHLKISDIEPFDETEYEPFVLDQSGIRFMPIYKLLAKKFALSYVSAITAPNKRFDRSAASEFLRVASALCAAPGQPYRYVACKSAKIP